MPLVSMKIRSEYRIESLTPKTFSGALRVIKEELWQNEAVSIATEVNKNPKAAEELLELCADAALDGVSLVAVVVKTGEVVAAIFNKIKVKTPSEKPFFEIFMKERCTQASSRALVNFMADVEGRCNLFELYNVDCIFDLMFLATLREHKKQKLGTLLCIYSTEVARKVRDGFVVPINVADLGPKYSHLKKSKPIETYPKICQFLCTVKETQKIVKNNKLKVHLMVPLSEYVFDGKRYTERIGDEDATCQIAALPLYES
ncbi:unnamed protein product [Euphydryas editha]|uniref:Dopamine N-acetyltransferase n=1 Tax=Euphydryas editha TaxID=104508 RepID=A0AAU9U0J3_EUPED|nr:unnamed protein product [Euphydryas editha]